MSILCEMDLIGTWELHSLEQRSHSGEIAYPMGEHCRGILIYDEYGWMNAQLMSPDRVSFTSQDIFGGSDSEIRNAIGSYVAYYGNYKVQREEQKVVHTVIGSLFPNWTGTTQERYFQFVGDILELSTTELEVRGNIIKVVLSWKKVTLTTEEPLVNTR